ncbi:MAG TPA: SpoIIE family protein phosphatase [Casimicrobiaceae bacterium]|jgi:phosphoserine phosphatase
MNTRAPRRHLAAHDLEAILGVTSKLAAPFDLGTMLAEVVAAAKQVLAAERGSVWLYDVAADELVMEVATGIAPVRMPSGTGLAGACARSRSIINVPDCYSDPRFDARVDRATGYRTRCMLTLPLVDHKDVLVGVMQVLNKKDGAFDADDEALATALAAQCAVALQRVRMTGALIEGEKMRQALEMAREVQMSTLPARMPVVAGYDIDTAFRPAELTGGDTYDVSRVGDDVVIVLGDATGHGIAPALSVTQMQAMLRMAFGMGASLETAFVHVNNQLAATLADDRFITAFVGLLDPAGHRVRFHSGGQGPIVRYRAASGDFERFGPTSFPLGAMPLASLAPAQSLEMQPGDILLLLSDGFYEQCDRAGEAFGEARVEAIVKSLQRASAGQLLAALLTAIDAFAGGAAQEDDMTAVVVRRVAAQADGRFARAFDSIPALVAFVESAFEHLGADPGLQPVVDLAVEELFTNMVKYGAGSNAAVEIDLRAIEDGVALTLVDRGVEPFDMTQRPDVDIDAPLEERVPGGLGLHLLRRMADSIEYEYKVANRESRVTLRFTRTGMAARSAAGGDGGRNARN